MNSIGRTPSLDPLKPVIQNNWLMGFSEKRARIIMLIQTMNLIDMKKTSANKMSTKFKISGYEDLNKVAMTKAFRAHSGKGLADSKRMTDSLLREGKLEFVIDEYEKAKKLYQELIDANAHVRIIKTSQDE